MKTKTTRKFYVEYLSGGTWWRFCTKFISLAAAKKFQAGLNYARRRIIEVVTIETVHKV